MQIINQNTSRTLWKSALNTPSICFTPIVKIIFPYVDIRDKRELMGQIEEDIGIYDMQKDNTMWKHTI